MLFTAITFGSIAGLITIGGIILSFVFASEQAAGMEWLGYLVMLIAMTMIFLGIKRFRDRDLGGVIKFLQALLMGVAISFVAAIIYVIVWEIYLQLTDHAFINLYAAQQLEMLTASGVSAEQLAAKEQELEQMKIQYMNPLFRLPTTFLEIFPVGLIIALISAAILRNPRVLPATK